MTKLEFLLPDNPFGSYPQKMAFLSRDIESLGQKAGTQNNKFRKEYSAIFIAIRNRQDLSIVLDKPVSVRALALLLQSNIQENIRLTDKVFRKIDDLRPSPSSLLIHSIYQHYLNMYDRLFDSSAVSKWLLSAMEKKGTLQGYHKNLLSENGPKWLVKQCLDNNREFSNELTHLGLNDYAAGRFLTKAKRIYFVEQLKAIPLNQPHPLLLELQNRETFESRYDEHLLLGHKALQILIERAPRSEIDDSWLNVILTVAGDPRVPTTHSNYQKWWAVLDPSLNTKVKGWLSYLDLRLFLEALENYSLKPGNQGLRRMFPSRKRFLEGLLDKNYITGTRLYLTSGFASYLRRNYKEEHLPEFSYVSTGSISVIHVQMGESHMIEGSHSCQLWIYRRLDPSAVVFDYTKTRVTYSELTQNMSFKMRQKGFPLQANIVHNASRYNWQHKAITALNDIGIGITAHDVLSTQDYLHYKRAYGFRSNVH